MIRRCAPSDLRRICEIINNAATAYKGVIPDDCYHEPYMPWQELEAEASLMTFYGWEEEEALVGVIALEEVAPDVTLIRHAYVLTSRQRRGIGVALVRHVTGLEKAKRLLVGTWADAWSVSFWRKQGFRLMPDADALLRSYWPRIPDRQRETSVVLELQR